MTASIGTPKNRSDSDPVKRFWSKVDRRGPDDCWFWQARLDKDGYGRFSLRHGFSVGAHRFAWEQENGPIPEGASILHSCDVRYSADDMTYRACVNPAHTSPGSNAENLRQMAERFRGVRGERQHKAKLTDQDVAEIRRLVDQPGTTTKTLADRFGVTMPTIRKIQLGTIWKHVG